MKNLDPAALDCLAALVDEGSFERAAHRLAITQSAVSQRLRALEVLVGQPLVVRTRPLRLTGPGQVLLRHARQWQALRGDVARALGWRSDAEDRVPIAVNADSLATWVLPALQPVVDAGLSLELVVDDQDFTHDWLREGRVLGCVSTVAEALRGCRVTPLCRMHYVAVASPAFVARRLAPGGLHHGNFAQVPFVVFNRKDDAQALWVERAFGVAQPRLLQRFVPSSEAYVQAVERGWGVGVAAWPLLKARVEAGTLVLLRPDVRVPVDLHWHQWKLADTGDGSASPGLLDRIGAALAAGAPTDGPPDDCV
jgi:LysR family transcriptional regulator (chromosome initiation inhibitor)